MNHDKLREFARSADTEAWDAANEALAERRPWRIALEAMSENISKRDLEFILECSPEAILALLDELRGAKAQALGDAANYVYKAWPNIAGVEIGDYLRTSADEQGAA